MSRFGPGVLPWADDEGPEVGDVIADALERIQREKELTAEEEREFALAGGQVAGEYERQPGFTGWFKKRKLRRRLPEIGEEGRPAPQQAGPSPPVRSMLPRPMFDQEPLPERPPRLMIPGFAGGSRSVPVDERDPGFLVSPDEAARRLEGRLPVDERILRGDLSDLSDPEIAAAIRARGAAATEGLGPEYTEVRGRGNKLWRLPRPGVTEARTEAEEAERGRFGGMISKRVEHERDVELEEERQTGRQELADLNAAYRAELAEQSAEARAARSEADFDRRLEIQRVQNQAMLDRLAEQARTRGASSTDRLLLANMVGTERAYISGLQSELRTLTDWSETMSASNLRVAQRKPEDEKNAALIAKYKTEEATRGRIAKQMEEANERIAWIQRAQTEMLGGGEGRESEDEYLQKLERQSLPEAEILRRMNERFPKAGR